MARFFHSQRLKPTAVLSYKMNRFREGITNCMELCCQSSARDTHAQQFQVQWIDSYLVHTVIQDLFPVIRAEGFPSTRPTMSV
jgi:hypothetical protein